jgi:hypothetical protein
MSVTHQENLAVAYRITRTDKDMSWDEIMKQVSGLIQYVAENQHMAHRVHEGRRLVGVWDYMQALHILYHDRQGWSEYVNMIYHNDSVHDRGGELWRHEKYPPTGEPFPFDRKAVYKMLPPSEEGRARRRVLRGYVDRIQSKPGSGKYLKLTGKKGHSMMTDELWKKFATGLDEGWRTYGMESRLLNVDHDVNLRNLARWYPDGGSLFRIPQDTSDQQDIWIHQKASFAVPAVMMERLFVPNFPEWKYHFNVSRYDSHESIVIKYAWLLFCAKTEPFPLNKPEFYEELFRQYMETRDIRRSVAREGLETHIPSDVVQDILHRSGLSDISATGRGRDEEIDNERIKRQKV